MLRLLRLVNVHFGFLCRRRRTGQSRVNGVDAPAAFCEEGDGPLRASARRGIGNSFGRVAYQKLGSWVCGWVDGWSYCNCVINFSFWPRNSAGGKAIGNVAVEPQRAASHYLACRAG